MLLIEANHIKKYFGDRLVLDVENLKIYATDRIGIVGANGVGKTTLMKILCQKISPDEGVVKLYSPYTYITQLQEPEVKIISDELASKFGISNIWKDSMSGGEKTRFKLAVVFQQESPLILADEPTSNLDMEGIGLLGKKFEEFRGGLVLISHDRHLLNTLCNKILEVKDGKIKIYNGNYEDYLIQVREEQERAEFEYTQYVNEKKRLEEVISEKKDQAKKMRKIPKRMGNSEARLHKMGNQGAKANLEKQTKSIQSRIERLEVKEKPKEESIIKLDIQDSQKIHSKILISGENIHKAFDSKVIFKKAEFAITNGSKVALIGPNGCGKSTLIKMIMEGKAPIRRAKGAKIGYFSQEINNLNYDASILENVMETSIYNETFVRILLDRLLFTKDDLHKKINVLSGGERVKVSFVKILLQDINLLILDEPTNYMDIKSLEVMEEALKEYDRTLLFVSHDRKLVETVADHIMTIEEKKIKIFKGSYEEYLDKKKNPPNQETKEIEEQIFVLETRLTELIGRLSAPSKTDNTTLLDEEYHKTLKELKRMRACL
ncbi:ribosomal protection-like ABC-F family protein [Alkaliphilus hydrothermalis]|uniref:Macrolide transport system ATP-binding/permease protein n=1 Tax=Alkaliphilus hydrothermalis TaxID=1482730 RepID=A0ABS2NRW7_9FIRM|nr:ABC-F type ribosomal protection protein [Alkaliphilus hydrothermalis]MBM7615685.1 macrolide transport system ATP-binding/permease protein [Alkaliphilus hydrothermalis]